ncbi:hypothetical protein ABSA28_00917 [Candidatus Hepatincolaceae symbiont of Richtersius coronifer]
MQDKQVIIITGAAGFLASHLIKALEEKFLIIGIDVKSFEHEEQEKQDYKTKVDIKSKLLYFFQNSSSNPCFIKYLINFILEKNLKIQAIIHTACPRILENDDRIENILQHFEIANIPIMLFKYYKQIVVGTEAIRLQAVLPYKLAKYSQELVCKEFNATYLKCNAFNNNQHLNHLVESFDEIDDLINQVSALLK